MTTRRQLGAAVIALAVAVGIFVLVDTGGEPTGSRGEDVPVVVLHVSVQAGGVSSEGGLRCWERRAEGTGELAGKARAACAAMPDLLDTLESRRGARVCAQIYGGDERVTIVGRAWGKRIDRPVDRTDGCGIEDWDRLEVLVGNSRN